MSRHRDRDDTWLISDLVDDALKPLTAGKLPSQGNAPDGSNALVANYPAGTVKLAAPGHGYSFYSAGDKDGVYVQGAKEVMFSYSVFFESGFDFVKGGKLPGVYGGTSLETAKSCSGGRQDSRDECFSARLMWRTNGMGELYNYYPTAVYGNSGYCSIGPMSKCDTTFGDSIGRGAFTFPTGEWTTVAMRLKLNDANVANGEQELFVNGQSVLKIDSLMISVNAQTKIYGIMAQTFFVSASRTFPPKLWLADIFEGRKRRLLGLTQRPERLVQGLVHGRAVVRQPTCGLNTLVIFIWSIWL